MLVMGGTRTFHRLACAIEDSGFIIKDTLMWIYGSGFPKAQEVSVLIDAKILGISTKEVNERREIIGKKKPFGRENRKKMMNGSPFNTQYENSPCEYNVTIPLTPEAKAWNGFKVGGIKPAYEPVIWAVKPPEGAYVDNVLKHGVGAVNVDECRIGVEQIESGRKNRKDQKDWGMNPIGFEVSKGRFPANVILDEEAGRLLDEQSGNLSQVGGAKKTTHDKGMFGIGQPGQVYFDGNAGASRFFYCAKASVEERNLGLELLEDKMFGKSGGAQIALSKGESEYKQEHIELNRIKRVKNDHPTVKPMALFQWLISLVTRKGQVVFDPFIGSGTTAIAALLTERECIGVDNESSYLRIAKARIEYWKKLPKQLKLEGLR